MGCNGTYEDPDTRRTYTVPSGQVLYRDPQTRALTTRNPADLKDPPGDRPDKGEEGCSDTGLGVVTPVCEKKRRERARLYSKNPFATK